RGRLLADMGAYVRTNGGVVPAKAAQFLPGPYRIPHFACEVQAVLTNKTPTGTYRGPGRFEANFFRERLLDLMASDLGLDPAEVRLKNLITPAELPWDIGTLVPYEASGEYDGGDYGGALRRALEASDYARLAKDNGRLVDGRLHGIGIGCFVESSGAGPAETGRIVVRGRGREGAVLTLATVAAEEVSLDAVGKFTTTALTYTYGAHVAHVAVDPETGATEVMKMVTVEDVGRAINPALVHGQALGSAVQGLG